MNTNYKEIARIIKSTFDDIKATFGYNWMKEDFDKFEQVKEARINEFADYFEREDKERVSKHLEHLQMKIKPLFNRQQFLKDCGLK